MTGSVQDQAAAAPEQRLIRALGVWGLAASIVNVTIGGGIFRLPASAASQLGGAAPLAYVVCAVAMGLIVLCFAEAGSRVALTGGPYAYVETAFGPLPGFLAGVLLWFVGTSAMAAVSTIFADSLGALIPALASPAARAAVLVAIFATVGMLNVRGVRQGTALNATATVAKLLPLVLLLVVGAFAIRAPNLAWEGAPAAGDLARSSIVLIFAFSGVESALVPSGEVKNVARTIPRAIGLAMVTVTAMYVGLHLVAQGVLGAALADSGTPLADAAAVALGPWGRTLILVGAAVSMFGYVSGMTLAVPRALFALGRDGFLPRRLAAVHPRYNTPYVAIVVQSVIVLALAITGTFEPLAILANLSTLLLYGACAMAAWQLRRRNVQAGGIPFRVPAAGVVPFLAVAVIAWMLSSIQPMEWAVVGGVMAAAAVLFAATARSRAARAQA